MVGRFCLICALAVFSFAASPEEIVSNLGGSGIEIENLIDENGNANLHFISKTLQQNGKLNLKSSGKVNTNLTFNSNGDSIVLLKAIKEVLFKMGYFNYENLSFKNSKNPSYSVLVTSDSIVDPGELYKELKKSNIFIENVNKKHKTSYTYTLNIKKANLYASSFGSAYKKPIRPYFVNIKGQHKVTIASQKGDVWHPKILVYDSNLKLLDSVFMDSSMQKFTLNLPKGANYIQVDDASSLENIKHGLEFSF